MEWRSWLILLPETCQRPHSRDVPAFQRASQGRLKDCLRGEFPKSGSKSAQRGAPKGRLKKRSKGSSQRAAQKALKGGLPKGGSKRARRGALKERTKGKRPKGASNRMSTDL